MENSCQWSGEDLETFVATPEVVHDSWAMNLGVGTLVRIHGNTRKQVFHPDLRSTPTVLESLDGRRTTIEFLPNGDRLVHHDDWRAEKSLPWTCPWRGYTIFYFGRSTQVVLKKGCCLLMNYQCMFRWGTLGVVLWLERRLQWDLQQGSPLR